MEEEEVIIPEELQGIVSTYEETDTEDNETQESVPSTEEENELPPELQGIVSKYEEEDDDENIKKKDEEKPLVSDGESEEESISLDTEEPADTQPVDSSTSETKEAFTADKIDAFKQGIHKIESGGFDNPYIALPGFRKYKKNETMANGEKAKGGETKFYDDNDKLAVTGKKKRISSASGKYQFLWGEHGDTIKKITGVKTQQEFLDTPKAQEKFMDSWVAKELVPGIKNVRKEVPEESKKYSDTDLMALIHFQGLPNAKKYLKTGQIPVGEDDNVSVDDYLSKFREGYTGFSPKPQVEEEIKSLDLPDYDIKDTEDTRQDLALKWEDNFAKIVEMYNKNSQQGPRTASGEEFFSIFGKEPMNPESFKEKQGVGLDTRVAAIKGFEEGKVKDATKPVTEGIVGGFLIGQEEEEVKPILDDMYNAFGFEFITQGIGDEIKVRAKNNAELVVSLDNFSDAEDIKQANVLAQFIQQNASKPQFADAKRLASLSRLNKNSEFKMLYDPKILKEEQVSLNSELNDIQKENIGLKKESSEFKQKLKAFEEKVLQVPKGKELPMELQLERRALQKESESLKQRGKAYDIQVGDFQERKKDIEQLMAAEFELKAEKGDMVGASYNTILKGAGRVAAGGIDVIIDGAYESANLLGMLEEGEDMDKLKKKAKKNLVPRFRNIYKDTLGVEGTSDEYTQKAQQGFWGGAWLSLMESLPAMAMTAPLGGGLLSGVKATSRLGRIALGLGKAVASPGTFVFGLQSSDFINEEMMKNPAFNNISERERWLIKAPLAVVNGVLENYGFKNVLKLNPGFLASLTKNALSKMGQKQGFKALENITKEEVKRAIRNGSLKKVGKGILAGGLAEFETETLQQLSEIAVKDIYNTAKGKELFKDIDFFSLKTLEESLYAGLQGAIGGKIMSSFGAVASGTRMYSLGNKATDMQFKLLNDIVLDSELRNLMVANLKNDILSGNMNYATAAATMQYIEQAASTFSEIPADINEAGRRGAFDLINEKKALEKEIAGKDPDIVAKQTERIAEIKNELKEISKSEEYAIQEPSTEGVDVRQQASDGETVGVRDTQEQQTTQEGQEVQDDTQDQEQVAKEEELDEETEEAVKSEADVLQEQLKSQQKEETKPSEFKEGDIVTPEMLERDEYTEQDGKFLGDAIKEGNEAGKQSKIVKINGVSEEGTSVDIRVVTSEGATTQTVFLKSKSTAPEQSKLRVQDEMDAPLNEKDIETISREMTELGGEQMNLSETEVTEAQSPTRDGKPLLDLNALKESKAANIQKELAKLGLEIDDATSMLEDWDGVPFMMAMSDMLASGEITDSQGNSMNVEGGGLYNTVGPNKEMAWAGVLEKDTQKMLRQARQIYADNKEYFDKWWKENPEYAGHIPVMVMRMNDSALHSNEATFRWLAPTIKKFPKAKRVAALELLKEKIRTNAPFQKIKKDETLSIGEKYLNFIKENKIKTLDQFLLALSKNAGERAATGVDLEGTFTLDERTAVFDVLFTKATKASSNAFVQLLTEMPKTEMTPTFERVYKDLNDVAKLSRRLKITEDQAQELVNAVNEGNKRKVYSIISKSEGFKRAIKRTATGSLADNMIAERTGFKDVDYKKYAKDLTNFLVTKTQYDKDGDSFLVKSVYEGIGEPAFKDLPQGSTMAVMGIELAKTNKDGEVIYEEGEIVDVSESVKAKHHNYHSGPKGKFLSFIANPRHGMSVFPEMRAKLAATYKQNKEGKLTSTEQAAAQTTSNFYQDLAFVGGKLSVTMDDTSLMVGRLRNIFPQIAVTMNQSEFDNFITQDGIRTRVSGDQVIYGVTKDNKIYINPEVATVGTALHEFGHVWMSYIKEENAPLYNKGIELAKKDKALYEKYEAKYRPIYEQEGMSEAEMEALIAEEVLVELIATKGETIKAAGLKARFKSWLNAMYKYIQKNFKLSRKLTVGDIENLTMQQFTESALADMIVSDEKKAKKLNYYRPAFEEGKSSLAKFSILGGMTPSQIIAFGRQEGFTESSIRRTLKDMFPKMKMEEIRQALAFTTPGGQLMLFKIPDSFGDVEGGIDVGSQMIDDIRTYVQDYVKNFKDKKKYAPTTNQIRTEAVKFLTRLPEYQDLKGNSTLQKQLRFDLDSMIAGQFDAQGTSKTLKAQMELLLKQIYQRKRGEKVRENAIKRVESMLRQDLPSTEYTKGEINKALSILKNAKPGEFDASWVEMTELVAKMENRLKKQATKSAIERYKKLAQTKIESGKRKSKRRVDENGVAFFKEAQRVLNAYFTENTNEIQEIEEQLFETDGSLKKSVLDAQEKVAAGEELNKNERELLATFNAFEVFHNINDISYQDAQDLFEIYNDFESAYKELMQGKLMQKAKEMRELKEAASTALEETAGDVLFTGESEFSKVTSEENNTYKKEVLEKWEKDTQSKDGAVVAVDGKNFKVTKQYDSKGNEIAPLIEVARRILVDQNEFNSSWSSLHQKIMDATYDVDSPVSRFLISIKETWNHMGQLTKDLGKGLGPLYRLAKTPIKNLPTYMNAMDSKLNNFFKEKIYNNLNRMYTDALRGYYSKIDVFNEMANDIFEGENGMKAAQELAGSRKSRVRIRMADGTNRVFSGATAMRLYALSKNEEVKRKMIQNNRGKSKFTKEGIEQLEANLDPKLKQFVDEVVDYLSNQYFEETNRAYEELNFVSLDRIENYFPLVTDSTNANRSVIDKAIGDGDFQGAFSAQYISPIKRRVDTKGAVVIDNSLGFFNTLDNHIKDVEKFKAYGKGVQEINAIIGSPAVSRYLDIKGTTDTVKALLNYSINPDAVNKTMFNHPVANFLYNAYTIAALGFKPIQFLKQASSFVAAYDSYEYKPGASEIENMVGFMYDMSRVWLKYRSYVEKARKMSPDFRARMDTMNVGALESFYGTDNMSKFMQNVHRTGGYFIRQGDIAGVMGYMANYIRDTENGMNERQAAEKFNEYNSTQQSRRPQDMTALQANRSLLIRGITMFGSTAFLQMNAMMQTWNNIFIKTNFKPWTADKKDVKRLFVQGVGANMLYFAVSNAAKLLFATTDEDEEEFYKDFFLKVVIPINTLQTSMIIFGNSLAWGMEIARGTNPYKAAQKLRSPINPMVQIGAATAKQIGEGNYGLALGQVQQLLTGVNPSMAEGLYGLAFEEGYEGRDIGKLLGIGKSSLPTPVEDMDMMQILNPDTYRMQQELDKAMEELAKKYPDMSEEQLKKEKLRAAKSRGIISF